MMIRTKILLITSAAVSLTLAAASCQDWLDANPTGQRDTEYVLSSSNAMRGLVNKCYTYLQHNYDNNEGIYLDCLTDNAVNTSTTSLLERMAVGTVKASDNPCNSEWVRDYRAIYLLNLFMQDRQGYNTVYMEDPELNAIYRDKLWGEAFGLRAWFYYDLLVKFGGKGTDGMMLGVPLILTPVDPDGVTDALQDNVVIRRNTYDECVAQILADCDSAYRYLPLAHRDFLVDDPDHLRVLGSINYGRIDGITTVAIKALTFLVWASPRFNPDGDLGRWRKAAQYAKEVIDFKLNVDGAVSGGFDRSKSINWLDPNNPEIVWAYSSETTSDLERAAFPRGLQGNGALGVSQNLVDCFGMADGYPLGQSPTYAYDAENDPYSNRDPRLYSTVFYNGRTVTTGTYSSTYTFECYTGGKDAPGAYSANARTSYYLKKFVNMSINFSDRTVQTRPHFYAMVRWTDMVLAFAEAANRFAGPETEVYGLTAKEAISWLRSRATTDGDAGIKTDPYLDEVAAQGREAFDLFLRNERRIETCFEGKWLFDLRRWSTGLEPFNGDVYSPVITANDDGTYTYDYDNVVETRVFSSAYLPIPYSEMLNADGMVQNEGWE